MLVTIFTDAGLCPETKCASWAAWCKSERGVSRAGGVLRDPQMFSTMAESAAAINGIHHALASGIARSGDTLLVQTDNDGVMRFLIHPIKAHYKEKDRRKKMRDAYGSLVSRYDISVRFRHVKGHQGSKDRRSAVNSWCDRVCRFFLKMARSEASPERWKAPEYCPPYGVSA